MIRSLRDFGCSPFSRVAFGLPLAALGLGAGSPAFGQGPWTALPIPVPSVVARSVKTGHADPAQVLHVAISMPVPNQAAFEAFAQDVSDPLSPNYRQFITPKQVGEMFGQPTANVHHIVDYLRGKGFTITLVADSHLNILADCTVAQAESAFHTTINKYHAPNPDEQGRLDYFAYSKPLQVPSLLASRILHVSGLQNFTKPKPRHKNLRSGLKLAGPSPLTPTQTRTLYNLAPLWGQGFQGQGRTMGISSFDGFQLSNVPLWYQTYGLPTPPGGVGSNITVVPVQGGSGSGFPGGEGDLDIQMELGQAPLAHLIIYDGGGDLIPVLAREQQDNAADVISESYGWPYDAVQAQAAHNIHVAMTAQGITYMLATGDTGTNIAPEPFSYGDYDPDILQVGGTVATFMQDGTRINEVTWFGSSGGWVTSPAPPFNVLPSWQVGNGVPTNVNFRLLPDVAMVAAGANDASDPGAYFFYYFGGQATGDGTSFSSPTFTGGLAVCEQVLSSELSGQTGQTGSFRLGNIAPLVYLQNGRSDVWYDIVSGPSNGPLPNGQASVPGPGWDTVTGWGAIDWTAFSNTFHPFAVPAVQAGIFNGQASGSTGGVPELARVDGGTFTLSSVRGSVGAMAAGQIKLQVPFGVSNVWAMQLNLVGSATHVVSNFTYLLNVNTGQFDLIQATPFGATNTYVKIHPSNWQNYIDGNNMITVVDRAVSPPRLGAKPFTLKLDEALGIGLSANN